MAADHVAALVKLSHLGHAEESGRADAVGGDEEVAAPSGALEQVGTPEELYEAPATRFVAGFIGRSSVLAGVWEAGTRAEGAVAFPGGVTWPARAGAPLEAGRPVDALARPESLALAPPAAAGSLAGEVVERRYTGQAALYAVRVEGIAEVEVLADAASAKAGDRVGVVRAAGGPPLRAYPRES